MSVYKVTFECISKSGSTYRLDQEFKNEDNIRAFCFEFCKEHDIVLGEGKIYKKDNDGKYGNLPYDSFRVNWL